MFELRKQKPQKSQFLGQGTYGCVLSPPLHSPPFSKTKTNKATTASREWIGKLTSKQFADEEFAHFELVRHADPSGLYGIYAARAPQRVDLASLDETTRANLAKCTVSDIVCALQHFPRTTVSNVSNVSKSSSSSSLPKSFLTISSQISQKICQKSSPKSSPKSLPKSSPKVKKETKETKKEETVELFETVLPRAMEGDMNAIIRALFAQNKRTLSSKDVITQTKQHLRACMRLVDGLRVYHEAGVVHRDIKPDNIVLADGTRDTPNAYKFIDFGASVLVSEIKAKDEWLEAPFVFRSLAATEVFTSRETKAFDLEASLTQSIQTQHDEVCLPEWTTTPHQLSVLFKHARIAIRDPDVRARLGKKTTLAKCASVHNDLYALGLVVGMLFSACSGTRLQLGRDGLARGVEGAARGHLGDCVAQFVWDMCAGRVWSWNLRERFKEIDDALEFA